MYSLELRCAIREPRIAFEMFSTFRELFSTCSRISAPTLHVGSQRHIRSANHWGVPTELGVPPSVQTLPDEIWAPSLTPSLYCSRSAVAWPADISSLAAEIKAAWFDFNVSYCSLAKVSCIFSELISAACSLEAVRLSPSRFLSTCGPGAFRSTFFSPSLGVFSLA